MQRTNPFMFGNTHTISQQASDALEQAVIDKADWFMLPGNRFDPFSQSVYEDALADLTVDERQMLCNMRAKGNYAGAGILLEYYVQAHARRLALALAEDVVTLAEVQADAMVTL